MKTIEVGSTKLAIGANETFQLSPDWIKEVVKKDGNKEIKDIVLKAIDDQKIKTGIVGINKKDGKLILIPVNVPNQK